MRSLRRPWQPIVTHGVTAILAVLVAVFSWFYRFNDPGGSFAGLTDDHFFYLVRGWQILFGELPVRDFVDHGAPLFYYLGAAVQVLFGRGTVSELAFTTTVLSFCAALTFVLGTRASGSKLAGLAGAIFLVLIEPRFYNYPKLLAYVIAIPLIWHYANRPSIPRVAWVAAASVLAFLFRHDHGVYVGVALLALMAVLTGVPWRERLRHAAAYALICFALIAPYLVFIQVNAGIVTYFEQASEWAARDRNRAPVVWPGLFDNPEGVSAAAMDGGPIERAVAVVRDNEVAWLFYVELTLPLVALAMLALSVTAFRPGWPQARAKLFSVAVLALALDAGFLRSPLEARLADTSVPLAILLAWAGASAVRMFAARDVLHPALWPYRWPVRVAGAMVVAGLLFVPVVTLTGDDLIGRLETARISEGWSRMVERAEGTAAELRASWRPETWLERPDRSELLDLSMYLNACTAPTDRVLVQAYIPQVVAMARRGFAGGHADLRPGFFGSVAAQQLTIRRLEAQSVPIVLLEDGDEYENFRKEFPLVTVYLDWNYEVAGTRVFDERFGTTLLVERGRQAQGTYEPLGWPCFASGRLQS